MDDVFALYRASGSLHHLFLLVSLCSIRLIAGFAVLPATSEQFLPGMARNAVIALIGLYVAFGIDPHRLEDLTVIQMTWLVAKEALVGLLIGFSASIVFWVAESVGALIDTQAGYNMVQLQNPLSDQQSTPVSTMLLQLIVATFWVLGGMLSFIGAVNDSFRVWPLMSPMPDLNALSDVTFLHQIDEMMRMVVKFSAPVLLVLLLIELSTGLVTRAADKLDPHSLSQPLKGAATMLMLALLCGVFIAQVHQFLLPIGVIDRLQLLLPSK
jgi:type III secretion protein T